jgi:hypothetical protein
MSGTDEVGTRAELSSDRNHCHWSNTAWNMTRRFAETSEPPPLCIKTDLSEQMES